MIGGGIAGLSCAEGLADSFDVTVYDTGRLRPGGRCSSREAGDRPKEQEELTFPLLSKYKYDHAAQVLTVPESPLFQDFSQQVSDWEDAGVLKKFTTNSVFNIYSADNVKPCPNDNLYFGSKGMGSIPLAMVDRNRFELKQDVWVSPSNGVKYLAQSKKWRVQANGKVLGEYDDLVIAHNGKCADRLMSKTPAKDVHALLRVNFAPSVAAHGGKRMTLNSIYSLTVCLDQEASQRLALCLPEHFVCGFIHNKKVLRFVSCQTNKYDQETQEGQSVWTILSSATFAKKYKAPQEFLPEERIEEVTELLLEALKEDVGLQSPEFLKKHVLDRRVQLWGAALPINVWDGHGSEGPPTGFIHDPDHNVGVCGDWLLDASIAGAWTSGKLLADHMKLSAKQETQDKAAIGLHGSFHRSEGAAKLGIGALR